MFIAAFFVQWLAMALFGIWGLVTEDIPQAVYHFVTTFSNIGGVLNLGVYIIIRRKQWAKGEKESVHEKASRDAVSDRYTHSKSDKDGLHTTEVSLERL